jgi:hypothetical protein
MSMANIPEVPAFDVDAQDAAALVLASIGFEELGLAHIINAEGEKIQRVLTLDPYPTYEQLVGVNKSVQETLEVVVLKEIVLFFKLGKILDFDFSKFCPPTT